MPRAHRLGIAPGKTWLESRRRSRTKLDGGAVADQPAPGFGVLGRKQFDQRDAREVRIRVPRLAVREPELGAFRDKVDVLGGQEILCSEVVSLEQPQLLQKNRALAPRAALGDGPAGKVG